MKLPLNRGTIPKPSRSTRAHLLTLIVGLILASPAAYAQGKWVKLTYTRRRAPNATGNSLQVNQDIFGGHDSRQALRNLCLKGACMSRIIWVLLIASLLPVVVVGQDKAKKLEPCRLLTADDAARIIGAPMKIVDLSKKSCEYGEYRGRGSFVRGGVLDRSLFFEVTRYKDSQALEKAWAKDTKSAIDPANKDQVLTGIGDEAYLVGRTADGKLTDNAALYSAALYVRKGTVTFSMAILLPPGHEPVTLSADALIMVAKKIADEL